MDDATNALLDELRAHNPWWDRGVAAFDLPPRHKSDFYHLVRPGHEGAQFTDQRVLALVGRRGVGKTTLVHQFVHHELASGNAVPEQFCYLPFDANPLYQLRSDEQLRRAVRYYESRVHGRAADAAPQFVLLDDVHRIEHQSKRAVDGWGTLVDELLAGREDRYVAVTASAAVQVDRELARAGVPENAYDTQPILPEKFRDYLYTQEPALEEDPRRVSPTSLRTGERSLPRAIESGDPEPFVAELRAKHDRVADVQGRIQSYVGQYLALGGVVSYATDEDEGDGEDRGDGGDDDRPGREGLTAQRSAAPPEPLESAETAAPATDDAADDLAVDDFVERRASAPREEPIATPTVAVDAFDRLRDDVRHALYQEVPGFESIQTIADLERLCALAAANRGAEPLRFQRLVELFDVDRRTLTESYLPALEQLYLLTAATEYDNSRPRSTRLYLRDTGLVTALAGVDPDAVRNDLGLEAEYAHLAGFDHTVRLAYGINAAQGTLPNSGSVSVQFWARTDPSVEYVFEVDGRPVPVGLAYRPGEEAATVESVESFCDAYDAPVGLVVTGDTAWAGEPVARVGERVVALPYWFYLLLC